jgi:hypothetical protein
MLMAVVAHSLVLALAQLLSTRFKARGIIGFEVETEVYRKRQRKS